MFKSDFTKNLLKLISGTFIAQVISILVAPILTRIYSPEEFGLFTLITSVFSVIALISGGRYENAILLPKKESHAANLLVLSLFINSVFILIFYLFLFFFLPLFEFKNISSWFFVAPILVFSVGFAQSFSAWFNRKSEYKKLVYSKIFTSLSTNFSTVGLGFMKINVNGLILGFLIGSVSNLIVVFYQLKNDFTFVRSSFDRRICVLLAKKYIKFPLFNSFQALLDSFQINAFTYFVSFCFGNFYLGFFSLAIRILMMPMNLIGGSLSQVFYQEATSKFNKGEKISSLMLQTVLKSIVFAMPILLVMLFFAPVIFKFVFGEKWELAGVYAQIISPWILFDFVRAPLSQVILIFNKQAHLLVISILGNVILGGILIYLNNIKFSLTDVLLVLSALQCLYILILLLWFFHIAKKHNFKN